MLQAKPSLTQSDLRVGACIYCKKTRDLSDEHVVPYGLGGGIVLKDASCQSCAKITRKFEGRVLRGFMHRVRTVASFPTRHPKERPTSVPITIFGREGKKTVSIPVADALAFVHLPVFKRAAFLEPRSYNSGIDVVRLETIGFGQPPDQLAKALGANRLQDSNTIDAVSFARMIGKIGYGLAVAFHGLSALEEVFVLPAILGEREDIGMWVGSCDFVPEAEHQGATHALATKTSPVVFGGPNTECLIVSMVKLFANVHPTCYEVVVGRSPLHI